ncbi:hypothetical protein QBC46DRAFT_139505 [Diplogelasinospora grovesii]|uniref:Uncharacterized protein n=1 Tax=Diplogelasinospora grovesii TaxID=303347 RepID=A0AAN6N641_9PEZI|nr:hypothetical protein QBC46DRAFT_139505 [Diplogelasinospora grovesii]
MDALKNLINNVPDWLKRLDELNGQIEKRQIELAQLTESQATADGAARLPPAATRSVRNKGSTESLKPNDEPEVHPREPTPQPEACQQQQPPASPTNAAALQAAQTAGAAAAAAATTQITTNTSPGRKGASPSSPSDSQSPSALQRQTNLVKAAGQARARATLRKRQRTDSVISAEGAAPKYRTRSMIIVYYDSYVQTFFEDLVKFVSASRNMMRKAKMAAKVAQIKRLAELEMPDDSDEEEDSKDQGAGGAALLGVNGGVGGTTIAPLPAVSSSLAATAFPTSAIAPLEAGEPSKDSADEEAAVQALRYVSTRRMQPTTASRTSPQNLLMPQLGRGIYARAGGRGMGIMAGSSYRGGPSLDPGMVAQPDVYDELDKGLEYVQSMCEHAAHQFLRDGDCGEEVGNIQRRLADTKELADREMERVKREEPEALKAAEEQMRGRSYRPQSMRRDIIGSPSAKEVKNELEVDEGIEDMDHDVMPKLVYKSTRLMR